MKKITNLLEYKKTKVKEDMIKQYIMFYGNQSSKQKLNKEVK